MSTRAFREQRTTKRGDVHGRDRGDRAGVGRESGEGSLSASLLDILVGETSGEGSSAVEWFDLRNNFRAVGKLRLVRTEDSDDCKGINESVVDLLLVVYIVEVVAAQLSVTLEGRNRLGTDRRRIAIHKR